MNADLGDEARVLAATLGSQYELVRLLGQGGMGRVYLAREPFLDRQVAVKVLPADVAATSDGRERFLREARIAARLSHPNIVPLHTFGQSGELLYFVMGFVDGESLEERLRREGRFPAETVRAILVELADALDYAHRAGVVHRDLKPDNVMIDASTGRAMLTDFGIAKQSATPETLTRTGMLIGTPHYMSPEQAAGDRTLDGRSDLYSLGVMAYRMLTGRLPFEGERVQDVLAQHITQAASPVEQHVADVPFELSNAVSRALAKSPEERWPTGRALRDSLSDDSDEGMPDDMRVLADQGPRLLAVAATMFGIAYLAGVLGGLNWFGCGVIAATGVFAPAVGLAATGALRRRYGFRAAMGAWLRQPQSWTRWWPRVGRRPGDVWDRLPPPVKRMRWYVTLMTAAYVPLLAVSIFIVRPSFSTTHWIGWNFVPVLLFVPTAMLVFLQTLRLNRWGMRQGLTRSDAARLTTEPTRSKAFWSRPEIARLLTSPSRVASPRPPSTAPRSILLEMDALARAESSSPHADVYQEAVRAAHIANDGIVRCDEELSRLAVDADVPERDRIQASLDALGETTADERAGKQEVRELLRKQLMLFHDLERRQSEVRSRRERLAEHLRLLGLQVAHLRAHAAEGPLDAAGVTGQIRSLCEDIDARVVGIAEVTQLLSPPRHSDPG